MLRCCIISLLCVQVFCALSLLTDSPYAWWADGGDSFALGLNLLQWHARQSGPGLKTSSSSIVSESKIENVQGIVWADPEVAAFQSSNDSGFEKVLVESGQVPHLERLSFWLLPPGAGAHVRGEAETTIVYFSLNGSCTVSIPETGEQEVIERGGSVLVPPGVHHQIRSGDALAEPASTTLAIRLPSGSWTGAVQGQAPLAIGGASAVAAPPTLRVAKTERIPAEKTAHESDLLSKRVHVRKGLVPGLLQLSVARFSPGAICEEHEHPTAAEVYVNYSGSGCHVAVRDPILGRVEHDLTGGKVAVIEPGTPHWAWNDAGGDCQNINLMINDPQEPV